MAGSPIFMRRAGAVVAVALVAASGCNAILGLHEVTLDPGGAGGAGGATITTTTATTTTTTTATTGAGGTGGDMLADFTLTIGALDAVVPLNGHAFLNVEIVPSGGFSGAVDVAAQATVSGLEVQGTQIPAGETKGVLVVGATAPFTLGQTFTLTLKATSGALLREAQVPATVTGEPGSLDASFGLNGVTSWPIDGLGGSLASITAASGGIFIAGALLAIQATSMFGARLAIDGGLDATFNSGGKVPGVVVPVFCGCGGLHPEDARAALPYGPGEVLVVGSAPRPDQTQDDLAIARFLADGTAAEASGDKGLRLIDVGGDFNDHVLAVALAPGPKLMVLGTWSSVGVDFMFAARVNAATTGLDPTFANGGRAIWQSRTPLGILVDSKGRTLVLSTENNSWHLDRLLADGNDDIQAVHGNGNTGFPVAFAVLPNDGVIVLTKRIDFAGSSFGLWHLEPDLSVTDLAPRSNPEMYDPTPSKSDDPVAIGVLPDGRLMVAGAHEGGGFLARILANGAPDPTFGGGLGWVDLSLGPQTSLQVMTVLADGKVLVGGTAATVPTRFVVGRVWN